MMISVKMIQFWIGTGYGTDFSSERELESVQNKEHGTNVGMDTRCWNGSDKEGVYENFAFSM